MKRDICNNIKFNISKAQSEATVVHLLSRTKFPGSSAPGVVVSKLSDSPAPHVLHFPRCTDNFELSYYIKLNSLIVLTSLITLR